jgi:hypothetical protein
VEAGGGESEGFELAGDELIERALRGDQQSAHAIPHRQGRAEGPALRYEDGEGDREYSSELGEEGFDDYEELDEEDEEEEEEEE